MPIYRVRYSSMTATYGPSYIEAGSEWEAKRKFMGTAFSPNEVGCITAKEISVAQLQRELKDSEN